MAEINRLITAEALIDNVPIATTTDHALLKKVIYNEQTTKIQNLLGTKLYEALLAEAVGGSLSGNRKILIDKYVIPSLYQYSFRAAVLHLNLRVTDKGVLAQSDINAAQGSEAQIKQLRNDLKNKAQFHADLAIKFICDKTEDFPEYNDLDDDGGIQGKKRGGFSGIVFR